jgi:hypothetical protein
MSFDAPNYTQAPNALLDEVLPAIDTLSELKVTLVVARQTLGWHREAVLLTLTLIQQLSGLSRQAASDGIQKALERGTVVRESAAKTYAYRLAVDGLEIRPLEEQTSLEIRPVDGLEIRPSRARGGLSVLKKEVKENTVAHARDASEDVNDVWSHYVEVMKPRRKQIDPEARRIILDALKVATAEECNGAIDGCKSSAFHMGDNDHGRKYNSLSQILRAKRPNPRLPNGRTVRESIDLFLEYAESQGVESTSVSVDPDRLVEAKLNVLTAHDYPGNELARKNGEMSVGWLARHGYHVGTDPVTGRPTFHLESE